MLAREIVDIGEKESVLREVLRMKILSEEAQDVDPLGEKMASNKRT